jgi:glycerophosphoryl diester phosphodiesterase
MEQGADGVELDVRVTSDRRAVVFHDEDLGRLGRPDVLVSRATWAELRSFDVGALVHLGPPGPPATIPCLEEVLEALPARARVNVELKGFPIVPDGLEVAVLRAVARAHAEDRVLFSAFSALRCRRLRTLAPDTYVAMLHGDLHDAPLRELWLFPLVAPHALNPAWPLCSPAYMAHTRALGLAVHTWTVNQPDDMRRLADLGVDAIITDVPHVAVAALAHVTPRAGTPP